MKFFIFSIIGLLLFTLDAGAATSLVVQAVADTNADPLSKQVEADLGKSLGHSADINVVASDKVDLVLSYYPAIPQPSHETLASSLTQAKTHYLHFQYDDAVSELHSILGRFSQEPGLLFEQGSVLRDAYIVLGLVHWAQQNEDKSVEVLKQVYRTDPHYRFDSHAYAPSFMKLTERAKSQEPFTPATLEVVTHPKVADVYLNGILQGVTPLKLSNLPPNHYALQIRANHYASFSQEVALQPADNVILKRELPWLPVAVAEVSPAVTTENPSDQIREALRIADLLKVDKVVMANVDAEGQGGTVTLRMVDRKYRAGHQPIFLSYKNDLSEVTQQMPAAVKELESQCRQNLAKNPMKYVNPEGIGSPVLLGRRNEDKKKIWIWSGVGTAAVAGLIGGILAASSSPPPAPTGSVSLRLQ